MDKAEFIAFDLETTGLSPHFDRIVEVGAVRFRADGTELERLQQLVDPGCPIPKEVTRIHGITDNMVRGQPPIEDVLPEFVRYVGRPQTILLAHNARFDIGFLSTALGRCNARFPRHPVVDTLALSRLRLRGLRNHRLDTVARHLRIADATEHRALGDALVVKSLFLKLLSQAPPIKRQGDLFRCIPPLSFEPLITAPLTLAARYQPLVEAIAVGRPVSLMYAGGSKGAGARQITPRSVVEIRGSQYVIAHCHLDGMEKHFRLDRIVEIGTT